MVVGVFLFVHIPSKAAVPFGIFDTRILLTEEERGKPTQNIQVYDSVEST